MEKVLFQVIRDEISFFCKVKKKKNSDMFSGWYHDCLYEMNDWSREGEWRIETTALTVGAVLPLHEQLINVPEPSVLMYTPPPM